MDLERLHINVRGTLKKISMAKLTWFRTGGDAWVFQPVDEDDILDFLEQVPHDIPVYPLGLGSNTLVRDGGYDGVIMRMNAFNDICVHDTCITVGAGAMDAKVAKIAHSHNITGLEYLIGIPGAIGGAIAMNAGAYGTETKDVLVSARGITRTGHVVEYTPDRLGMSYRCCAVAPDVIFTRAVFKGRLGKADDIARTMENITTNRTQTQPVRSATGGSTFRNPDGAKAWELIDSVGLRGAIVGDACISDKHCNFLINQGSATSRDLEDLIEMAIDKVQNIHAIILHPEIKIIGKKQ